MIGERKQDLYIALKEESKVLQMKFSQISAEAIYYTFLNKQVKNDKTTSNSFNNINSNELQNKKENAQDCKHSDVTNNNSKYNQKIGNDNKINKSRLLYYSLANEFSVLKSKSECELKEGLYKIITLNSINKLNKTNINNATKQKQKVKDHSNKVNVNDSKDVKMKRNNSMKKTDCHHGDTDTKLVKSGGKHNELIQALKKEHCLMNWKKNAEKAELSFLERFAKKEKPKKEHHVANTKQKGVEKQCKKVSQKLQFVIQKSLCEEYRLCLKQKKNREDEEIVYQKYLSHSMDAIPLSASKSKVISKSVGKRK
ncbi:GATA zinc finger domain-containing protein 4 [Octopus sinensis]|uniref:GATA zinc finger domain-containing protein 4 n=1 Tax=Octopus sinensis TaxID=2607531 RepID=A0A6P7S9B8_9MOLL|nr:GATA zinc finger domain-containing protein 4 [Octopus sinensis]